MPSSYTFPIIRNPYAGPDGTSPLPGYSFANDPDTGLFSQAANIIGVALGGTEGLRFQGTQLTFPSAGVALSAASAYAILRNAAATNVLQYNVPTGTYHMFTVNDVSKLETSVSRLDVRNTLWIRWPDAGVAIPGAGDYTIGRDGGGTNVLQYNVPTGSLHLFSVNNVSKMEASGSRLDIRNNLWVRWADAGAAIPGAADYTIGRNADATNALQVNAPANSPIFLSVNNSDILRVDQSAAVNRLGFFGTTPSARPAAYTQTYAAADRTHAATQTAAAMSGITSSTGGTALAEPGASYAQGEHQQNYRRIQDRLNELRLDLDDVRQLANAVIDDLQAYGMLL